MSSREDALEREVARLEHARDLCVEELGHANERANRLLDRVTAAESERDAARAEVKALREALGRLEWSFRQTSLRNGGTIYTATLCPACMGEKDPPDDKGPRRKRGDPLPPAGHKPDCWLARALSSPAAPSTGDGGALASQETR